MSVRVASASRDRTRLVFNAVLGFVVVIVVAAALTTPRFLTVDNARAILASGSLVGITAMGATLVMICGSVLSMAASQTASAAAILFLASLGLGLPLALAATIGMAVLVTATFGAAIGYWGANPIVLTIAGGFAVTGASFWLSDGENVYPAGESYTVLNATPLGIPLSVIALVIVTILTHLLLTRTTYGRQMYLVGESRPSARAAGLPVGRVVVAAWAFFGLTIGITGAFMGAFTTTANTLIGGSLTLDAIAAVLVGGTAIAGGRGSALRTFGGTLLIVAIADILLLRGYSTGVQTLVKGVLVLVAVLLIHISSGRKATR